MNIIIIHYRDKCIGCNSCVEHAPKQWMISDEDGKSILIGGEHKRDNIYVLSISEAELPENELAAEDCPGDNIKIDKK